MTRGEALKILDTIPTIGEQVDALEMAIKALEQPERKKGKWIHYDSDSDKYDDIRCSECKKSFTVDASRWTDIGFIASDLKFCPSCGARMERGEQE